MFVGKVKKKEDLEIMSLRSITGDSPYIYTMKVVCKVSLLIAHVLRIMRINGKPEIVMELQFLLVIIKISRKIPEPEIQNKGECQKLHTRGVS